MLVDRPADVSKEAPEVRPGTARVIGRGSQNMTREEPWHVIRHFNGHTGIQTFTSLTETFPKNYSRGSRFLLLCIDYDRLLILYFFLVNSFMADCTHTLMGYLANKEAILPTAKS